MIAIRKLLTVTALITEKDEKVYGNLALSVASAKIPTKNTAEIQVAQLSVNQSGKYNCKKISPIKKLVEEIIRTSL
jgi:hypothetical protein